MSNIAIAQEYVQEELSIEQIIAKYLPPFYKQVQEKMDGELEVMIEFRKAKIVSNLFLEVEWDENIYIDGVIHATIANKKTIQLLATQDLLICFTNLANHALQILGLQDNAKFHNMQASIIYGWEIPKYYQDEMENKEISFLDRQYLSKTKITMVSWGGSESTRGISMKGKLKVPNNKVATLDVPFTKFYDEDSNYPFAEELEQASSKLERELLLYVYVGKIDKEIANNQTEMDFSEN